MTQYFCFLVHNTLDDIRPILSTPSLKDLMTYVAVPAMDQFKMIGIGLGFDMPTLNAIEQNSKTVNDCFANLFGRWLQQEPSRLTWETVFSALESQLVGRHDLVNGLRKTLEQ